MLNKVLLIGNLTRDVEIRYSQGSGVAIAKFGLAVNRRWKDKNSGEDREETMFIDVNVFGRSAEIANQYLSKGRQVLIEGRLVFEQWTDQNGQKRSKHTISAENLQFIGSRNDADRGERYEGGYQQNADNSYAPPQPQPNVGVDRQQSPTPPTTQSISVEDEEIPF
ncbi:MAG: single-stranded DNA-binding protein [Helicobacteraceae bacterium]|nr:single-stranded DNA-binding protein [Helicobacteraceae bacterium]